MVEGQLGPRGLFFRLGYGYSGQAVLQDGLPTGAHRSVGPHLLDNHDARIGVSLRSGLFGCEAVLLSLNTAS